jgi:hypothetical protein
MGEGGYPYRSQTMQRPICRHTGSRFAPTYTQQVGALTG